MWEITGEHGVVDDIRLSPSFVSFAATPTPLRRSQRKVASKLEVPPGFYVRDMKKTG